MQIMNSWPITRSQKPGLFTPYYILLQTMHMARHFVLEHHSSTAARSISATRLPVSTTEY